MWLAALEQWPCIVHLCWREYGTQDTDTGETDENDPVAARLNRVRVLSLIAGSCGAEHVNNWYRTQ